MVHNWYIVYIYYPVTGPALTHVGLPRIGRQRSEYLLSLPQVDRIETPPNIHRSPVDHSRVDPNFCFLNLSNIQESKSNC